MVEIYSNDILLKPIKSCKDAELTKAYRKMMLQLRRAGILSKKHIMDNEVSEAPEAIIKNEHNMQMEMVPPGSHCRNVAEVAIRNFKANLLRVLYGT